MYHCTKIIIISMLLANNLGGCAVRSTTAEVSEAPAGFELWLSEQCPDGRTLHTSDERGRQTDTSCEEVRKLILADSTAREEAVNSYMAATEDRQCDPSGGERTCEARDPWSPLGVLCTIFVIAGSSILHEAGCHHHGSEYPGGQLGCTGTVVGVWDVPLGIACAFL